MRVHYQGMHIDFVPYIVHPDGYEAIINRDDNTFERTDPAAFTRWMRERDDIANKNLRKVIRLMKYLRDHKNSFTGTRWIILTTLLGKRVDDTKRLWMPDAYSDVPTALLTIVTDLDDWLTLQFSKPHVSQTPSTPVSISTTGGTMSPSTTSRPASTCTLEQIREAYEEENFEESVKKWQALFGDGFKAPKPSSSSKFGAAGGAAATGRAG